jgi:hypothetical protein
VQVAKHLSPLDIDEASPAQANGAQSSAPSLADASEASGDGANPIRPHAASASSPATSLPNIAAIISPGAFARIKRPPDRTGAAQRAASEHCFAVRLDRCW